MVLDTKEQRDIILNALMTMPIQGDYQGIIEALPKFTEVVKAVEEATIAEDINQ